MRIVVGYGAGNKDALAGRLMTILGLQEKAIAGGLRIASEKNIYEAAVELTKASDFTAPQRFWTDPATLPPPEPQPDPNMEMVKVEASKVQSNEKVKSAEMMRDEQESLRKDTLERYKADLDAQVKIYLKQIEKGASVDLEKLRAHFKTAPPVIQTQVEDMASRLAEIANQTEATLNDFASRLESIMQQMEAPREVIRDKNGRITGVRINGVEKPVARDSSGRVTGIQ